MRFGKKGRPEGEKEKETLSHAHHWWAHELEGEPKNALEVVAHDDARGVDAARFEGLERHFEETGSITASFKRMGLEDYTRRETSITAQHAETADLEHLKLSPGAIVLITQAVNVDGEGKPVQYSLTRFAADRVELQVDGRDV